MCKRSPLMKGGLARGANVQFLIRFVEELRFSRGLFSRCVRVLLLQRQPLKRNRNRGAKPIKSLTMTARLKSCPDTKLSFSTAYSEAGTARLKWGPRAIQG